MRILIQLDQIKIKKVKRNKKIKDNVTLLDLLSLSQKVNDEWIETD